MVGGYSWKLYLNRKLFIIRDNIISHSHYGYKGGGLYIDTCFNTCFLRNRIDYGIAQPPSNEDTYGGGVFINFSSLDFYNNIFSNNATVGENGSISIDGITAANKINFINCNVFGNAEAGGVHINGDTINSISFINTMFWGNGNGNTFIINATYPHKVATVEYCWFFDGVSSIYVNFFEPTYGNLPGVVNITSDFNLKLNSSCIDQGNPDNDIYGDIFFPPSQGTDTNDIGVTGGPYTVSDSSSKLLLVKNPGHINVYFTATVNPFFNNGMVMLHDFSTLISPSEDDEYHWFFGDGTDTVYNANEHVNFPHQYSTDITEATITLIVKAGANIRYLSVTVTPWNPSVEKDITQNMDFKLRLPEENKKVYDIPKDVNNQIVLFPNPSNGIINILNNLPSKNEMDIKIYNTSGLAVFSGFVDFSQSNIYSIDLTSYLQGIYFIQFNNDEIKVLKKIIIAK